MQLCTSVLICALIWSIRNVNTYVHLYYCYFSQWLIEYFSIYCISNLETVHERTVVYIRCYTYTYYIVSYIYIVVICKLMSCWLFTVATTRLPSDCRVPITEVACCRWCRLIFNSRDVHSGCPSTRLKTERLADAADGVQRSTGMHA